jgi:hypothetical protein
MLSISSKLLLTALVTTGALLASAFATAGASRLSISDTDFVMSANDYFFASGRTPAQHGASCRITLRGAFNSSVIAKTVGSSIGTITAFTANNCSAGDSITALPASLPWTITYQSFSGTLPSIASVKVALLRFALLIDFGDGLRCLSQTEAGDSQRIDLVRGVSGVITGFASDQSDEILMHDLPDSNLCDGESPGYYVWRGSFTSESRSNSLIFLRLI